MARPVKLNSPIRKRLPPLLRLLTWLPPALLLAGCAAAAIANLWWVLFGLGSDPSTSVIEPDSRTNDHLNLYLLGSGVFPTVGTANPTLSFAALLPRAAETIRQELQQTASSLAKS